MSLLTRIEYHFAQGANFGRVIYNPNGEHVSSYTVTLYINGKVKHCAQVSGPGCQSIDAAEKLFHQHNVPCNEKEIKKAKPAAKRGRKPAKRGLVH